uniref:Uncharacterized protein n=1 Tax=Strongyloides stercoralis TaxID=6248 RepID=A0A0K0DSU6_STRER
MKLLYIIFVVLIFNTNCFSEVLSQSIPVKYCDQYDCEKKCIAQSKIGVCHKVDMYVDTHRVLGECHCEDLHVTDLKDLG